MYYYYIVANLSSRVRWETRYGRVYLVAPMTLIVPGVLNGSSGPLLYTAEENRRNPTAWNGVPIVVYHPRGSARSPDQPVVGRVYNTSVSTTGTLRAEGWFDRDDLARTDSTLLHTLASGARVELSTGLKLSTTPTPGVYNGVQYHAIARDYHPDHLAILPTGVGACSVRAGCGVNVSNTLPSPPGTVPTPHSSFLPSTPVYNCSHPVGTPYLPDRLAPKDIHVAGPQPRTDDPSCSCTTNPPVGAQNMYPDDPMYQNDIQELPLVVPDFASGYSSPVLNAQQALESVVDSGGDPAAWQALFTQAYQQRQVEVSTLMSPHRARGSRSLPNHPQGQEVSTNSSSYPHGEIPLVPPTLSFSPPGR
jgi:hypothetical protein